MGEYGIMWEIPDLCGFSVHECWDRSSLVLLECPVDKSVANESLMFERGKFLHYRAEISAGIVGHAIDVEQIGIGDHDRLAFADGATCDEPVRTDVAASPQGAR